MAKTGIRVFDIFINSLRNLENQDSELYSWSKNRIALTHALAIQLYTEFGKHGMNFNADMSPVLSYKNRKICPDILVHDRKTGLKALAIICRNGYLSESEQKSLADMSRLNCELTMAVSFFPKKRYTLLYRATSNGLEYYHFDRNTLTASAVRTITDTSKSLNKDQLPLENLK